MKLEKIARLKTAFSLLHTNVDYLPVVLNYAIGRPGDWFDALLRRTARAAFHNAALIYDEVSGE